MATASDLPTPTVRGLFARDGWAIMLAAVATLVVELGTYGAVLLAGGESRQATVAAVFACLGWVVMAAPAMAAGGRSGLSRLFRGWVIADATGVTMLVLWLTGSSMSILAVLGAYGTCLAMTLAAVGGVCLARTAPGRLAAAVGCSALMLGALASPLWCGGLLTATDGRAAAAVVWANPVYSVGSLMADRAHFVWHQWGMMYDVTTLRDYAPPAAPWYAAIAVWGGAAVVLLLAGRAWKRLRWRNGSVQ